MTQEEAEFAGRQVLDQLQERKLDRHKDYNRNIFSIRTDDQLAEKIRTFCKDNKVPPNQFIKTVLQNYFNDELKTTIQSSSTSSYQMEH
jgi:predicted HicB family RNase H-like nuclease